MISSGLEPFVKHLMKQNFGPKKNVNLDGEIESCSVEVLVRVDVGEKESGLRYLPLDIAP